MTKPNSTYHKDYYKDNQKFKRICRLLRYDLESGKIDKEAFEILINALKKAYGVREKKK
jgi:hypothetical protein